MVNGISFTYESAGVDKTDMDGMVSLSGHPLLVQRNFARSRTEAYMQRLEEGE